MKFARSTEIETTLGSIMPQARKEFVRGGGPPLVEATRRWREEKEGEEFFCRFIAQLIENLQGDGEIQARKDARSRVRRNFSQYLRDVFGRGLLLI